MSTPVIDTTKARLEREYKLTSPLLACRFDPSGRFLFASAQDQKIHRVDLLTGETLALAGHESWVRSIVCIPASSQTGVAETLAWEQSGEASTALVGGFNLARPTPPVFPFTLVTADYHGKIIWWAHGEAQPTRTRTIEAHDGWIRAIACSPDGQLLATAGNDGLVKVWSAADGRLVHSFAGHESHVYNVAFHPREPRLASADLKGIVKDWNLQTGQHVRDFDAKILNKYDPTFRADIGGARSMTFAPDGKRLACAGITNVSNAFAGVGNPAVILFDWSAGTSTQFKTKEAFQGTAWGVAFHPDGSVLAAGGGSGGRLWVWKGSDPTSVLTVNLPSNARDMALSPSGTRVAVATSRGSAYTYTLLAAGAPAAKSKK